jgi:hypothetical protein
MICLPRAATTTNDSEGAAVKAKEEANGAKNNIEEASKDVGTGVGIGQSAFACRKPWKYVYHHREKRCVQQWSSSVLHWLAGVVGGLVRGRAVADARTGRMKNKKVKMVATRANMFTETEVLWNAGEASELGILRQNLVAFILFGRLCLFMFLFLWEQGPVGYFIS